MPARIGEDQVGRPEELRGVEPDHAAGYQEAVDWGDREIRAARRDVSTLDPGREQARRNGEREPGQQRADIAAEVEAAALPPEDDQEGDGEGGGHRLREERAEEESRSPKVRR